MWLQKLKYLDSLNFPKHLALSFERRERYMPETRGCGCGFGGDNCCWIIILFILIICCCGNGFGGNGCGC